MKANKSLRYGDTLYYEGHHPVWFKSPSKNPSFDIEVEFKETGQKIWVTWDKVEPELYQSPKFVDTQLEEDPITATEVRKSCPDVVKPLPPAYTLEGKDRKVVPMYHGFMMYFPKAMQEVARLSFLANEQHNPGTPMHWDRSKSGDELDAMMRHAKDAGTVDDDGQWHDTKVAWRAMANLEKLLESKS